jgi:hypothetical protein
MQGAAPNVFPTGWSISTGTLTATCIGSGVENDIEYIDIQVLGTATSGFLNIRPNPTPSGILAAVNDNFCGSIYYKLVSGNFPNFPNLPNLQIQELNGVNFLLGSAVNTPATSTLTRVEVNRTMNQPTVNNVGIRWGHDATGTFNYVVRLGLPQLERGLKARDIIRTKGTLVSVYQSPTNIITQGGDFIVSRNTGATRVGPNGLIETAKTNLALHSEAFDNAAYFSFNLNAFGSGSVANTTATLDPMGTNFADYIQENSVAGVSHALIYIAAGNVSGTTYTYSVFAKAAERTIINLLNNAGGGGTANFNLNTGTATLFGGISASMVNYGNGWWRCILTYNSTHTGNHNVQVRLCDASGNSTYNGTGNQGANIFGAQLEVGSSASEYIPTTTVARTRFAGVTVDGTIAANIPRIDWLGQSCPALLVEASGSNGILNSADTTTNWTLGSSLTSGAIDVIGVTGNNITVAVSGSGIGSAAGRYVRFSNNVILASGSTYTVSFLMKKTGAHTIGGYQLSMSSGVIGAGFNVSGSFSSGSNVDTAPTTNRIRRVEQWGTDVFRCSETFTMTAAATGTHLAFGPVSTVAVSTNSAVGTSIGFAAPQIELGAFPTTFIPTTTGTGSRAADVISASGALVSGLIGQTEGTIYAEVDVKALQGTVAKTFIDIGATNNRIFIGFTSLASNTIRLQIDTSANPARVDIRSTVSSAGIIKVAAAYQSGNCVLYVNGVAGTVSANDSLSFSTLSSVFIGQTIAGTAFLNDRIRAAALYTTRLTDAQLAELTRL